MPLSAVRCRSSGGQVNGLGCSSWRSRFIHAADIHLDSPLKGLERYENAPVERIRGATRRAFTRLIDLAIEKARRFRADRGRPL